MARIFISYRRSDSDGFVGRLYDHLKRVVSDSQLYLDVESTEPGHNFVHDIEDAIARSDVVLVVIGNQWLNARDTIGQRRLDVPKDYVRLEVASALRQHKLVIPVLIQNAKLPTAETLPRELKELEHLQAAMLSHGNFEHDVDRLITAIKNRLDVAFLSDKEFGSHLAIFFDLAGYTVSSDTVAGLYSGGLIIEETRFGDTRRILVLAQATKTPLTSTDVATIHAQHAIQYGARAIDEIAVVTLGGLDRDAELLVKSIREITHVKYSDLQDSAMDFRSYVAALISQYDDDGLSSYYISLKSRRNNSNQTADLEAQVLSWIGSPQNQPVAILGGYGSGKTTFARRLAYVLAREHRKDSTHRIPILLRLGDISAEQTLEGLLGKHFTTNTIVRNYSFDIFMSLNLSGRFVIILDGFDEMKHTLSWEEFRYNFSQLNRLVAGESKVVLLGRPTAFLTDEEQEYALHGIARNIQGHKLHDTNWPDYIEHYISTFDENDIKEFLTQYLRFRAKSTNSRGAPNIVRQISRVKSSKHLLDLAGRPVQLKMLAEVLPQWKGDLDQLTMSTLYSYFIDLTIQREQGKLARRRFDGRERREFAGAIAWWLWTSRKEVSFVPENVPDEIIQPFSKLGEDVESVRRDLISACFLERKLGGALYFPHRSFQEFLVGERMLEQIGRGSLTLEEALKWLTPEVVTFIKGMLGSKELGMLSSAVARYRGTMPLDFLMIFASSEELRDHLLLDMQRRFDSIAIRHVVTDQGFLNSPWCALLCALLVNQYDQYKHMARPLIEILLQDIDVRSQEIARSAKRRTIGNAGYIPVNETDHVDDDIVLGSLTDFLCICSLAEVAGKGLAAKLEHRLAAVGVAKLCEIGILTEAHDRHNQKSIELVPDYRIADIISRIQIAKKSGTLTTRGIYHALGKYLLHYCWLLGWVGQDGPHFKGLKLVGTLLQVPSQELEALTAFQARFEFVPLSQEVNKGGG